MNTQSASLLEILEPRIAPATLFMGANPDSVESSILTQSGAAANNSPAEIAAQTATGADVAILLNAGDRIDFDANGDSKFSIAAGDFNLIQVTSGKAMVFFEDLDGNNRISPWEITGLAVSNNFNGTVNSDIHGSVVTALNGDNFSTGANSTIAVQNSSIAGLRVAGYIEGGVYAGGNINGVRAGQGIYGSVGYSVLGIAAGTDSADFGISLDGGDTTLTTAFTLPNAVGKNGANGASISNITLSLGTFSIEAGNGQSAEGNGNGGHGGSITNVQINSGLNAPVAGYSSILIAAGDGGWGGLNTGKGAGGNGGSITNVKLTQSVAGLVLSPDAGSGEAGIGVESGSGGEGNGDKANGGSGGNISGVKLNVLSSVASVEFNAKEGGNANGSGNGGAAGSILNSTLSLGGRLGGVDTSDPDAPVFFGAIELHANDGGSSYGGGTGGAGGSISGVTIQQLDAESSYQSIIVQAGNGGGMDLRPTDDPDFNDYVVSKGGAGGAISRLTLLVKGNIGMEDVSEGALYIGAGNGGAATVQGGAGGGLTNANLQIANIRTDLTQIITAGNGGGLLAGTKGVSGGNGGVLSHVFLRINDLDGDAFRNPDRDATLLVAAGRGGDGGVNQQGLRPMANTGAGGHGGALTNFTLDATDDFANLELSSGSGGMSGDNSSKAAGNGGALTGVIGRWVLDANVDGWIKIFAGDGGDANLLGSAGGNGGALASVNLSLIGGVEGEVVVGSGDGGDGGRGTYDEPTDTYTLAGKGKGGNGGSLSNVKIDGREEMNSVFVFAGSGGEAGNSTEVEGGDDVFTAWAAGGNGGALSGVTVTTPRLSGNALDTPLFAIWAGEGGDGTTGGAGGALSNVTAFTGADGDEAGSEESWNDIVSIGAGDGGNALTGAGGVGGAVSNVTLEGTDFELYGGIEILGGRGGESELGTGGNGGSITNLKVDVEEVISFSAGIPDPEDDPENFSPYALYVNAGSGGEGLKTGGTGGNLSAISIRTDGLGDYSEDDFGNVEADYPGGLFVGAGYGGSGGDYDYDEVAETYSNLVSGKGGNAGHASGISIEVLGDTRGVVQIDAGDGGESVNNPGGSGGALSNVKLTSHGVISGYNDLDENRVFAIDMSSGDGGETAGKGKGGTAANLSNVTITNLGGIQGNVFIFAGGGGDADLEDGGAAGSISGLTIINQAPLGPEGIEIQTESGGDSNVTNGGNAGSITNVKVLGETAHGELRINNDSSGFGGTSLASKGGLGGSISKVVLDVPGMNVAIGYGGPEAAVGSGNSQGGNAGKISEISGEVGHLSIMAQSGGQALAPAGKGGNGGSIDKVNITAVASQVSMLAAGSGGNAALAANVGAGGSVTNVSVDGDIGNFSQPFGEAMGGILAGQGGSANGLVNFAKNGSVLNILADRIAAILASNTTQPFPQLPNLLSGDFSVFKLDKVTATVIGANIVENDGGGTIDKPLFDFDFIDNTGSPGTFDNGDLSLDGLVVVRASGYIAGVSTSVLPLHAISTAT